jgi:hypothetical protein
LTMTQQKPSTPNTSNRRTLVVNRLEMGSKDVFRQHYGLITELIGDSPGVYALYDENELYYVGKSTDLRKRVAHHLRDRHFAGWTHFSLYLVRNEDHIHEIESLLVRIAHPKGNRVVPRGKSRGPLLKQLRSLVKQKQKQELVDLFGSKPVEPKIVKLEHESTLKGLVKRRTPLYRTYKGKEHTATLYPNGTIAFQGKQFGSASAAAKAVAKGSVNGWKFWYIEDLNGEWVKLGAYKSGRG